MNNIIKNMLLALTLICVIALIVFCIQLIVLNRGVESRDTGTTISGGVQQESQDENIPEETDLLNGQDDEAVLQPVADTPRPPPQGIRRQLMVTPESRLVIYARDELFEFIVGELEYWFVYTGEGEATLEIAFSSISPQGIVVTAETFLNKYSGSTTSEFTGEEVIQNSKLNGFHVSTMSGRGIYEAWIHMLADSDLALVFVIFYENDGQRDALYEVLSTLEIISADEAAAAGSTLDTSDTDNIGDTEDTNTDNSNDQDEVNNEDQE